MVRNIVETFLRQFLFLDCFLHCQTVSSPCLEILSSRLVHSLLNSFLRILVCPVYASLTPFLNFLGCFPSLLKNLKVVKGAFSKFTVKILSQWILMHGDSLFLRKWIMHYPSTHPIREFSTPVPSNPFAQQIIMHIISLCVCTRNLVDLDWRMILIESPY